MSDDDKPKLRYLRKILADAEHDEGGNPMPLASIGIGIPIDRGLGAETARVSVEPATRLDRQKDEEGNAAPDLVARIIPDTQIIETSSDLLADILLSTNGYEVRHWEEIDAPNKSTIAEMERTTKAHVAFREEVAKAVAAGDVPAPDLTDTAEGAEALATGDNPQGGDA